MAIDLTACLADELAGQAAGSVFGVPGSGASLALIDALERRGVAFHTVQHEGAAAIMAGTLGCLTGRPGVALSIKGPGLANMVPGLALCHLEGFPVVAIAEAYLPGTPAYRAHKRVDQKALVTACSKGQFMTDDSGLCFSRAGRLAKSERPGPVLLELTEKPVADRQTLQDDAVEAAESPAADQPVLPKGCARPVLIVGTLGIRLSLSAALNRLRIPVFSTAAAKGVVDETLPHSAGVFTGVGSSLTAEASILPLADCVVAIGLRANEVLGVAGFKAPVVAIDVVTDPGEAIWGFESISSPAAVPQLMDDLARFEWGQNEIRAADGTIRTAAARGGFLPAEIFEAVERCFGAGARVVLDTGNFCTIGEHLFRARRPHDVLLSGQGRYMGVGLPMAIAAAIHDPGRPVVLVVGDGGIGPWIGELRLACALRLPLMIILATDGGFSSIRGRALRDGLTLKPLTPANPSWHAVAKGFGLITAVAEDADGLARALEAWSPIEGTAYIEARFPAKAYDAMIEGIR